LGVRKSPPSIKLVRLTIEDDRFKGAIRQKINVIIKNNGDITAFMTKGFVIADANETICNCDQIAMRFRLSEADWTYDVDISEESSYFIGNHSIEPNEVVNFNVLIGRDFGGHEATVYRSIMRLEFDEGEELETDAFHLMISGPLVVRGGHRAKGPSPEEWGTCQADNIRRLQKIGFDYRPFIEASSRHYIEAVAPGLFDE
jgi:hypothetical protein